MKTAIIYATSHGTTEKVAIQIKNVLDSDNVQLFNLKQNKKVDLSSFEQVVIGGSIHAGQIQGSVKTFCRNNMVDLLQKRVALFICGMNKPEFETELSNAFPELLRKHAVSSMVVGGEFLFGKMNFIEKLIVRKVSGVSQNVSKIDDAKVNELILCLS
jgi:menaquinone-dependent protoporphyrinogen oxidase